MQNATSVQEIFCRNPNNVEGGDRRLMYTDTEREVEKKEEKVTGDETLMFLSLHQLEAYSRLCLCHWSLLTPWELGHSFRTPFWLRLHAVEAL